MAENQIDFKTIGIATVIASLVGTGGSSLVTSKIHGQESPDVSVLKSEVKRDFNDVDRRLNRVEESLSTIRSEQREQGNEIEGIGRTLDIIKCIVTDDYDADGCELMRPRNRGQR